MKRLAMLLLAVAAALCVSAQTKAKTPFSYKFYGHIRADLFYNSRANEETVDGLFYMYPKDREYDAIGNDINLGAQGNMYLLYTRLGVDIVGPKIGSASTSAKVEVDFRGSGTSFAMPRIRHAYFNFAWRHTDLLVGQTWHPLFGEVSPSVLSLNTGAPFQPFNRSPQIRLRYHFGKNLQLIVSAVWQQQYTSAGPDGKTHNYLKNSGVPELFAGVDFKQTRWQVGAGIEFMSLMPRRLVTYQGKVYKVDERANSLSFEAHAKYKGDNFMISAKSTLAGNLTQCSMLGGFAVTSVGDFGKCSYTPFRHSMTWLNFVYGRKIQPGVFIGYLKNLGTDKPIVGDIYGVGLDVDRILSISAQISYNLPHWRIGIEYTPCTAWYGTLNKENGRIEEPHSVTNYRVLGVMVYTF